MVRFYIFGILFFIASSMNSQSKKLNGKSIELVEQQCKVCTKNRGEENVYLSKKKVHSLFHNYHTAVFRNDSEKVISFENQLQEEFNKSESTLLPYFHFLRGKFFLKKKIYSKTLIAFKKALNSAPNTTLQGHILINMAVVNQEQKDFKLALANLKSAQIIFENLKNELELKNISKNKALCYLHLKDYDTSEIIYHNLLQKEKELKDTLSLAVTTMDLANLYYVQYRDDEAIPLFKKALEYAIIAKEPKILKTAYLNMSVVEENLKHYKVALSYFKKYRRINDSIFKSDRVWQLAEQQKVFELEKKEKEISLLEKDKLLNLAALKIKNQQRNLFISIIIGLLIITLVIGFFYKNNIRKKELIQEQKNDLDKLNDFKNELFSVLAHDLRSHVNNLMFVNDELETAYTHKNNEKIKSLILQNKTSTNNTFQLLDNLLHWVMIQSKRMFFQRERIKLLGLIKYMEETYSSAIRLKNINFIIDVPNDMTFFFDMNSLKIILRNLIDNAIKFTPEYGIITIVGIQDVNTNTLAIKDTGIGMNEEQLLDLKSTFLKASKDTSGRKSTGLGLRLCYSFLKKNNGEIVINSIQNQGTTVQLILPKTYRS
jgi:signal transduction histidine kinase